MMQYSLIRPRVAPTDRQKVVISMDQSDMPRFLSSSLAAQDYRINDRCALKLLRQTAQFKLTQYGKNTTY